MSAPTTSVAEAVRVPQAPAELLFQPYRLGSTPTTRRHITAGGPKGTPTIRRWRRRVARRRKPAWTIDGDKACSAKKSWSATTVRSSRSSHTGVQDGRSDRHGARDDRSRFGCRRFSIRRLRQHPQVKSCGGGRARVDGGPSHSPANISRLFPKKKSERVAGGTAQATPVAANRITVRSTWAYRANRDPLRIGGLCCCNMDQAAHP
jgi:hypothetical protein